MIQRVTKISAVLIFLWIGYQVVYVTPTQKAMNQAVNSYKSQNTFTETFEDTKTVSGLFKKDWSGWHELVVQNSNFAIRRPVRYCLIKPSTCFLNENLGNYIELSQNIRRRGKHALKFYAAPFKKTWFGDSRMAIRRQLFDFNKGDDIYFSGWFYFKGPEKTKNDMADNLHQNLFLSFRARNESLRTLGEPGPSLFFPFRNSLGLRFDNWLPALNEIQQDLLNRTQMPLNEWVQIKMHLKLSELKSEGLVEVWLNEKKVISERAQTLPRAKTTYSILELGIGSNLNQKEGQTMYVDNISVSPARFID